MQSRTIILDKPTIDLPKNWENTKVFIDFPNDETIIVKKAGASKPAINYNIDDANWSAIKDEARSARGEVFKQFYPELYGAKQKA